MFCGALFRVGMPRRRGRVDDIAFRGHGPLTLPPFQISGPTVGAITHTAACSRVLSWVRW